MSVLDRSLIVILPKKPFLDWCRRTPPDRDITVEVVEDLPGAFLVPCCHFEVEVGTILEAAFPPIFIIALSGWTTNQDVWPDVEDTETFLSWFDVIFSGSVIDLADSPLITDEKTVDA